MTSEKNAQEFSQTFVKQNPELGMQFDWLKLINCSQPSGNPGVEPSKEGYGLLEWGEVRNRQNQVENED